MNLRKRTKPPEEVEEVKFPYLLVLNKCQHCGTLSSFRATEYYIGGCPLNCNGLHRCTDQHVVAEYVCPECNRQSSVEVFSD